MSDAKVAGSIKAINVASVHKICSGQVVLTLATAVKELVENSLDAGATIIEVKLKEYGSELVEVVDNGHGVRDCDFESLTLKHHTSKLEDFSDLTSVATFGFRGEALSSLCALSNLSIATCHKDSSLGTRLEYDHNGALVKTSPISRQAGTTVSLQNLFFTFPVRHKEFLRNLRREYGKMIQLLTAYCLVCTNTRITCVNHTGKGKKSVVLSTNSASTVRDNITCVFGAKQANSLKELVQRTPSESVLAEFYISKAPAESLDAFRLKGYVSSCAHGDGRSSSDRQFFFINGRPCDLPKVSKVINEVYHSFNRHQFPFVFLDISLEKDSVDVNVTPDKRKIFIQHEKLLLATVKSSLLCIYDQQPSIINSSPLGIMKDNKNLGSIMSHFSSAAHSEENKSPSLSNLKRAFPCDSKDAEDSSVHLFKSPRISNSGSCTKGNSVNDEKNNSNAINLTGNENLGGSSDLSMFDPSSPSFPIQGFTYKSTVLDSESLDFDTKKILFQKSCRDQQINLSSTKTNTESSSTNKNISELSEINSVSSSPCKKSNSLQNGINFALTVPFHEDKVLGKVSEKIKSTKSSPLTDILKFCRTPAEKCVSAQVCALQCNDKGSSKTSLNRSLSEFFEVKADSCGTSSQSIVHDVGEELIPSSESEEQLVPENESEDQLIPGNEVEEKHFPWNESEEKPVPVSELEDCSSQTLSCASDELETTSEHITVDFPVQRRKKVTYCAFSLDSIKEKLQNKGKPTSSNCSEFRRFRSKILPTENESAEDELRREISKDMFSQMEIIGQFNLGFIIARLKDDLFIVDQHATDEKYNYEILQRDTVLQTQKLLVPQKLDLTAVTEAVLLDNMHIFEKNGFKFNVEEDEKPGQRVHLVSVPVSQNWSFGKEDVDELIFMLTDNSGRMCRPSRVNQMFASRACRKSVMIGTPLSVKDMKKLVCHMGEIEQPWNCPHGRPTLRHLFSLNIL